METKIIVATWRHLQIICESCNNHKGFSKENYPFEVEILTELNFQINFHTCTSLLDKYFEEESGIYKCIKF